MPVAKFEGGDYCPQLGTVACVHNGAVITGTLPLEAEGNLARDLSWTFTFLEKWHSRAGGAYHTTRGTFVKETGSSSRGSCVRGMAAIVDARSVNYKQHLTAVVAIDEAWVGR